MRTIPDVVEEMPADAADRALLIDDASPDDTTTVALEHGLDVLRHPANRGYGGSQKTGYVRALLDGADVVVMVHADNQYDPGLVAEMAAPILAGEADIVIGSRLLDDRAIAGGMPRWKWVGNRLLTGIENRAFGVRFSEYHTGYRAFSADFLRSIPFLRNSDDFVFDQEIFAQMLARGARVREIPIPTRYFHEASSVDFLTSLRYALKTLGVLGALPARPPLGAAPPSRRMDRADADSSGDPVAALAIRIAFVLATPDYTLVHDAIDYDRHAASIATGHGFALSYGRPTAFRPPAYPFFVAGVYELVGTADKAQRVEWARIANAFVGIGIVALIGLIAFQLWGRREALIALALGAIYIPLILVGQSVMSEPLFVLCLLGAIAVRPASRAYPWVIAAGVLMGLAILGRANAIDPARAAGVRGVEAAAGPGAAGRAVRRRRADGAAVDDPQLRDVRRLRAGLDAARLRAGRAPTTARRGRTRSTRRRGGRSSASTTTGRSSTRSAARPSPCSRSSCAARRSTSSRRTRPTW